ncbi:MAG: transketolase family protein [Candidatus Wallacebacter cryptica]
MSKNSIPCRKAFTETLLELARQDRDIIALTSDARGSVTLEQFAAELPEQFVEVGIAEQNLVGIGAGLAAAGKKPFVCGPACFLSARSLEQVKVDAAYSRTNVKIIGVSGGVSYGALGSTHHAVHDLAVMRAIPDLTVILPADAHQTRKMTAALTAMEGPVYVRMGRGAVPDVYTEADAPFEIGKANVLLEGNDAAIIACGEMVRPALDAGLKLREQGIDARVIDLHTIKPLDTAAVLSAARETGAIVTVEEHSVHGGLGAAVAEVIVQNHPVPMEILGIPDEPAVTGESPQIFAHYRLTGEGIALAVQKLLARRKGGR